MTALNATAAPPRAAILFAAVIALIGWSALVTDFVQAMAQALSHGRSLAVAVPDYLRFFTIQANFALALLMSVTARALLRGQRPPPASLFRAALVYMIVTCLTYELLLRSTWSPRGVQFVTDFAFHDLQPALALAFWLGFAPKRELAWRNLPWLLAYPTLYLAGTLIAGALGAGYPYDFLDPGKFGSLGLAAIVGAFLALFLALGALATLVGQRANLTRSSTQG